MKKFLGKLATAFVACMFLAIFAAGALSGCKSGDKVAAQLAVSYATAKYIEKAGPDGIADRVTKVRSMCNTLDDLVTGEAVTIDALKAYVLTRLDHLSIADRVLAGALIDAAVLELKARVGEGILKPDALVRVREVIEWVRAGSNYFAAPE